MKRTAILLLGLALAFGTFSAACGGGSNDKSTPAATESGASPTDTGTHTGGDAEALDAYFSDLLALLTQSRTDSRAIESSLTDQLNGAQTVDDAKTYLNQGVDDFESVAQTFRDGMAGLDPPAAVTDQHEAILAAYDDGIDAFEQIKRDLNGVQTEADLNALAGNIGSQFADLTDRTQTTCAQLQTIADDNGLSVSLDC